MHGAECYRCAALCLFEPDLTQLSCCKTPQRSTLREKRGIVTTFCASKSAQQVVQETINLIRTRTANAKRGSPRVLNSNNHQNTPQNDLANEARYRPSQQRPINEHTTLFVAALAQQEVVKKPHLEHLLSQVVVVTEHVSSSGTAMTVADEDQRVCAVDKAWECTINLVHHSTKSTATQ
jgi:hypothetical protein